MPSEPQPRIDKDDVPRCSNLCRHFRPFVNWQMDDRCEATGEFTMVGTPCLPAVRAITAELRELKEDHSDLIASIEGRESGEARPFDEFLKELESD